MGLPRAEIGVFGGSGFYSFLEGVSEYTVDTPYGGPSDRVAVGEVEGRAVAFLPRHGRHHQFPAHRVNYRANVWAMKELGVTRIIGPCAAGSLQTEAAPGSFVICDQLVDRTSGRSDTFYDGPLTTHVSFADPYCPELRPIAVKRADELGITQSAGWKVVNMTGYPEALLARELEICYVNISLITDYDVGLEGMGGIEPVSHAEVVRVFEHNISKLRSLLLTLIPAVPRERSCVCSNALSGARFEV